MGAVQSAGGAATSGAQITGAQLAKAIREASLRAPDVALDNNIVPQSVTERSGSFCSGAANVYAEEQTFEFDFGDDEGHKSTMRVTSYAPQAFRHLRWLEGVAEEHFVEEWTLPDDRSKPELGEGRSMAMFLKSNNMDYMCKTISPVEVEVLRGVLEAYSTYLVEKQHSLLMRFLMLLKIEANNDIGYLLVFSDCFATCPRLNERWDIKGRIPKPGKFLHFPSQGEPYGVPEPPSAFNTNTSHSVYGDPKEENPPGSPTSRSIRTKKDKELTRVFWCETERRDELLKQLNADFDFLCSNGLMDYSILVGVRYNNENLPEMRQDAHLHDPASPPRADVQGVEIRPDRVPFGRGSAGQHVSRCKYHEGIESVGGHETYYIGIIDMLTVYNGKKMSANFFKGFLWDAATLSTVPPETYRERISTYANLIFASPDDDLERVAEMHAAAS